MPKSAARTRGLGSRVQRAFTLVELLVVVGIITVLMGLVITAGVLVTGGGRENQTLNTLRTLEQTLNSMVTDLGGRTPDPFVEIPGRSGLIYPVADARNMSSNDRAMINSVGLFMLQAEALGRPAESLKGLSSRIVRRYTPHEIGVHENDDAIPDMPTVFDGFGNPIRYVHPVFQGELYGDPARTASGDASQPIRFSEHREFFELAGLRRPADKQWGIGSIRRNAQVTGDGPDGPADSDGGITPSQRPYFYSMGPSGRVGSRRTAGGEIVEDYNKDNVYTSAPRFQQRQ